MFLEPETRGGGGSRRPTWRIIYEDGDITVTSWYVETGGVRIPIADLGEVLVCLTYRYPVVKVTAVLGLIEATIAGATAAALESGWVIVAGLVAVGTVATGAITDSRKNPRFMTIEANRCGRPVVLFRTQDKQKFGQVRRALIRAVEENRRLLS